jgi:uncharacterized protein YjbI with pentapeptide repeats
MQLQALFAAFGLIALLSASSFAESYNPIHLKQLRDTNKCPGCNLKGADLRLNLEGADLRGTDLRGADLKGANLKQADLENADLSNAKNLTSNQVKQAKNWKKAKYDAALLNQLGISSN